MLSSMLDQAREETPMISFINPDNFIFYYFIYLLFYSFRDIMRTEEAVKS